MTNIWVEVWVFLRNGSTSLLETHGLGGCSFPGQLWLQVPDVPHPILTAVLFFCFLPQLWIMPAFGARPQFDNDTELNFYGDSMWPAIVDICLPFGIFYRMHAVASLLEVYIMS